MNYYLEYYMDKINKVIYFLGAILLIKKIFLNDVVDLGPIDRHYGIVFFIFFVLAVSSDLYLKKKKKRD